MSYDYYSQNSGKYKQQHGNKRRIKLVVIGVVLVLVGIVGIRQLKHHPEWQESIESYQTGVLSWMGDWKQKLHQTVATVQHEVDEGSTEPPVVKFEFYNTLQDMQAMQASVKPAIKPADNKSVIKPSTEKPKLAAKIKQPPISHADDLEKDILSTMKKTGGNKT